MTDRATAARVIEVFSAIQGEGPIVGTRQLFVRFAQCDLRCDYCDSDRTWLAPDTCDIEQTPGLRDFVTESNPVPLDRLLAWVQRLDRPNLHDSISLTGGEPLLHSPFLQQFLPALKAVCTLPIYLETGGHRPQQLEPLLPWIDWVGMDLKLPSVSGETHWAAHEQMLRLCVEAQKWVFVKAIVSESTTLEDLTRSAELVSAVDPHLVYVMQPVSPLPAPIKPDRQPPQPPTPAQVLHWQQHLKQWLPQTIVIPQTHKAIGQL